jgi:hypothetical protein
MHSRVRAPLAARNARICVRLLALPGACAFATFRGTNEVRRFGPIAHHERHTEAFTRVATSLCAARGYPCPANVGARGLVVGCVSVTSGAEERAGALAVFVDAGAAVRDATGVTVDADGGVIRAPACNAACH